MKDYVIGCDEAGRGCLLGALVMTAFAVERDKEQTLKSMGARDSKELTAQKREDIRAKIEEIGIHRTVSITAPQINDAMGAKVSLNELEARQLAALLDGFVHELQAGGDAVSAIYIDSPDPVPAKYAIRIKKAAPGLAHANIVAENHAENKHGSVAAASIVAKTTRDAELSLIKELFSEDFGTGYTHDKRTIDFVRKHMTDRRLDPYVRTKWKTYKNLQTVQVDLKKFI